MEQEDKFPFVFALSSILAFCLLSASRISLLLRNKLRRRAMERRRRRGRRWCAPNENESVEHKPTKPRNNRIAVSPRPSPSVRATTVSFAMSLAVR